MIMVRIAEALKDSVNEGTINAIRWDETRGYVLDDYPLDRVDTSDPRKFILKDFLPNPVFALTSISWKCARSAASDGCT